MTPEGKTKARIKQILCEFGAYYFMPKGSTYGTSGIPDFVCCYNGRFIGIEAKAGANKLSGPQRLQHKNIKNHGGLVITVYDKESDYEALRELLRGVNNAESNI